ncbi:MAG: hypothetical protein MI723_10575, partial [Caulobacterales bacterium]|nr:hypothetical protein [Caulobacterales bacterium]
MDPRRRRRALLSLPLAAALSSAAAAEAPLSAITEARWLAERADALAALGPEPPECLPESARADPQVRAGRAAFRTPLLLGGQAARAGLACVGCHRNGGDHPDFHFTGLSGAPGTADVTSALFSKVRGDGVFNPAPIPSLVAGAGAPSVPRDPASGALEAFIRAQIVEEFDGPAPSETVVADLAAYVRSLSADACPPAGEVDRLERRLADVADAVAAALAALEREDGEAARLMIASARTELGRIHERFPGAQGEGVRAALVEADRALAA